MLEWLLMVVVVVGGVFVGTVVYEKMRREREAREGLQKLADMVQRMANKKIPDMVVEIRQIEAAIVWVSTMPDGGDDNWEDVREWAELAELEHVDNPHIQRGVELILEMCVALETGDKGGAARALKNFQLTDLPML